jgi:mycothiol synthase
MNLPPGFTSRPAIPDDLDAVAALRDAYDIAHVGVAEANRAALQFEWAAAWLELDRDVRLIHHGDGALVGYVEHSSPDPSSRFEVQAVVAREFEGRGLGSAIIDWTEARTRSRRSPGVSTSVWNAAASTNSAALALFASKGYVPIRTFWKMAIELDPSFQAGPLPHGVSIRPFVLEVDGPAAVAAMNAAFTTHFGYHEETFEDWVAQQRADETWDPTLELVAEMDGRIVGASNNGVIDGTGWVFELGVLPELQGRGIGKALLRHSLAMFVAMGITAGRLGVDSENVTGAVQLYRSVGMEPVQEQRVVEKRIESG